MSKRSASENAHTDRIMEAVEGLLEEVSPVDGTRILTDVLVLTARVEYGPDGGTSSQVTILPMQEDMPDWRAIGLLEYARDIYRRDDSL